MRLLRSRVCHAALPFPVFPLCRFVMRFQFCHPFPVYIILYYIYIYYIYYYNNIYNIYKSQRNTFRSFKSIMKRENGKTGKRHNGRTAEEKYNITLSDFAKCKKITS